MEMIARVQFGACSGEGAAVRRLIVREVCGIRIGRSLRIVDSVALLKKHVEEKARFCGK